LKPERSQNQELQAGIGCQYLEIGISYFDRDIWDLIYWRLDFDNRWKPLNLSRAWIYGTEYSLKGSTGQGGFRSEVTLSHRWMRAINLSGEPNTHGNFLPYRPQNSTTLSLRQSLKYLTVDLSARWVDRRFTNEPNTKSLSPYKVWDLGISKRLQLFNSDANLDLRAEIRNLFNENYRIVSGAPVPLREWWISATIGSR
ncbi:MAG TPA: TonB-dependent receptor, partial [Bacteroidetes bacterium]|nr:TonB-dependent receptor [Bacteroidota bacterium]